MLLLKYLLEPWGIKSKNIWHEYQKHACIEKLDDIVDKYNNIYHRTIKMKPIDIDECRYFDFDIENCEKILNLVFVTTKKNWNIKTVLQKGTLSVGQKKFLWLKKIENSAPHT